MDIKDLNKSQLILLALLLSFITSIATGIVTITLMQQAPSSVTVPINRVIKQTVEKIVPAENKNTVQTVVVKEEDLVVDAIDKNKSSIFSVFKETKDLEGKTIEISVGKGFAISGNGVLVADGSLVYENGTYFVKNDSGKFKAEFISLDKDGFAILKIGPPLDEKNKLSFTVPVFGDLSKMKPGQKILVLGSSISSFLFEGNKDLKINVSKSNAGAMVLNLDGEVLGIALSGDMTTSFTPITSILDSQKETKTETKTP